MIRFLSLIAALVSSGGFLAQTTPRASLPAMASANIIQPISMVKTADLSFGNIASGTADGTVAVMVEGDRTSNGGVTLLEAGASSNSAGFYVQGYADASFLILLPSSILVETPGGTDQMQVNNFVSNLGTDAVLDRNGEALIKVGATLNVSAQQAAGMYSGTFDVIVAYN